MPVSLRTNEKIIRGRDNGFEEEHPARDPFCWRHCICALFDDGIGAVAFRRCRQDRRSDRHEQPLRIVDGTRFGLGGSDGRRRLRRDGARQADRDHLGGPPEQGRRRSPDGPDVVGSREGRRHRRSAGVGHRPGGQGGRSRAEEDRHHHRCRRLGSEQRRVFPLQRPLELRHLFQRLRRRAGAGAPGLQGLVLHHRRLFLRRSAPGRHHRGDHCGGARVSSGR